MSTTVGWSVGVLVCSCLASVAWAAIGQWKSYTPFDVQIVCTADSFRLIVTHRAGPFSGVVYTEGGYERAPHCRAFVDDQQRVVFTVDYDKCDTKREDDNSYSNVVVVQHDRRIMTAHDAAFKVTCKPTDGESPSEIQTFASYRVDDAPKKASSEQKQYWQGKQKWRKDVADTDSGDKGGKNATRVIHDAKWLM